jgi:hypothetical protein
MNRVYRVLGTDRDGLPVDSSAPSARSALQSVADMNRLAVKAGQPADWRAEYADLTWRPLTTAELAEEKS